MNTKIAPSYGCRKCGAQFNWTLNGRCPTCRSKDIIEIYCAYCDHYKNRKEPCVMGHSTIVPFNMSCDEWTPRNKDKPEVE